MCPGPAKNFDPEQALEAARDLFWSKGYGATSVAELENALGVGRKSLYDTFGNKRKLYLRALAQYSDTVIGRICQGLEDSRSSAFENLERVLGRLGAHHGSKESLGCFLGVAMAQADSRDEELGAFLRDYLLKLERAFERTLNQAKNDGAVCDQVNARDVARNLVALTQGMALIGRVNNTPEIQNSIIDAALQNLRRKTQSKPRAKRSQGKKK